MKEKQTAGNNEEGVLMKQLEREIFTAAKAFHLLSLLGKSKKANNRSRLAKVETVIECVRWEQ